MTEEPEAAPVPDPLASCVGLPDPQGTLPAILMFGAGRTEFLGWDGPIEVSRWQDRSGARLVITQARGSILGWSLGFETLKAVRVGSLTPVDRHTAVIEVVDRWGTPVTSTGVALEQATFVKAPVDSVGMVSVAALGFDVWVHADETAFRASPDAHLAERGGARSIELASSSFLPQGLFDGPSGLVPLAQLTGTVRSAERRTTASTGRSFIVASVTCLGLDLDVCLAEDRHPTLPEPGNVIGGEVFMLGDVPRFAPGLYVEPKRRSWFRR